MQTLNLEEAAQLLKMHPSTVLAKARSGQLPAAKPGKCWVFIDEDLFAWLRGMYVTQSQEDGEEKTDAQARLISSKKQDLPITLSNSALTEKLYAELLAPKAKRQRKEKPATR
jgi:excisionase family DNA binding protein